jgi:probable HAF family extracellular repeat protein
MSVLDVEDAWDINNKGQILCGSSLLQIGESSSLYEDGSYYALNDLVLNLGGWSMLDGLAINDSGQIVGTGYIDGEEHAFLMTPMPEPTSLMFLFFAGFMGKGILIQSRKES